MFSSQTLKKYFFIKIYFIVDLYILLLRNNARVIKKKSNARDYS